MSQTDRTLACTTHRMLWALIIHAVLAETDARAGDANSAVALRGTGALGARHSSDAVFKGWGVHYQYSGSLNAAELVLSGGLEVILDDRALLRMSASGGWVYEPCVSSPLGLLSSSAGVDGEAGFRVDLARLELGWTAGLGLGVSEWEVVWVDAVTTPIPEQTTWELMGGTRGFISWGKGDSALSGGAARRLRVRPGLELRVDERLRTLAGALKADEVKTPMFRVALSITGTLEVEGARGRAGR